jgi:arabinose-5-phosphate isomerase
MKDVLFEMTRKRLGLTTVAEPGGRLLGVISDGDLRRALEHDDGLLRRSAGECMRTAPKTISGEELAPAALKKMEDHRITALMVCDEAGRLEGVVHVHDLWRLELF